MEKPKVVLLIFASGKIVLAGGKTRDDINLAYKQIYPVLYNFKKGSSSIELLKNAPREEITN